MEEERERENRRRNSGRLLKFVSGPAHGGWSSKTLLRTPRSNPPELENWGVAEATLHPTTTTRALSPEANLLAARGPIGIRDAPNNVE